MDDLDIHHIVIFLFKFFLAKKKSTNNKEQKPKPIISKVLKITI